MTSRSCGPTASRIDSTWTSKDELGLAGFPLLLGLADAGDHAEPVLEGGDRAARDRFVRLAEEPAALRVADDGALHAELVEHGSRRLAGERSLGRPVDVLGVGAEAGVDCRGERRERRTEDDVDAVRRLEGIGEGPRLRGPLEHLPVPRNQHFRRGRRGPPSNFSLFGNGARV